MALSGVARGLVVLLLLLGSAGATRAPEPSLTDAAEARANLKDPRWRTTAAGPRTSPFEPPKANDHQFVTDAASMLDTGCVFRSAGPIRFNIEITRYVGELNPDGTLKDAAALVAAGLLSPTATLIMPGFDVDSGATPEPPTEPEIDRVFFNGEPIGTLSGENNAWKLNSFEIPIEKVKFAARAAPGSSPAPVLNEVRIDIDTANVPREVWCTSMDWGALSFKAMSPIVLVHGNNSNGGFFTRQGFTNHLQARQLLFDNSINMPTDTIAANGARLNGLIPGIVKSYGVDSIHLVVHSKGGLDSREYLANYQPAHEQDFQILSYTSLSTPHNGSVAADVLVEYSAAVAVTSKLEFSGFPDYIEEVISATSLDTGTGNLTTSFLAGFNAGNLSRLPSGTTFHTVAADADTNRNGQIDRSPDEYLQLRTESATLTALDATFFGEKKTRIAVDTVYQTLRSTASVTVTRTRNFFGKTVITLTSVPTPEPLGNDVLVTVPSGEAVGSLEPRVAHSRVFNGTEGRNHSNVADEGVARVVTPWIIEVERSRGDLQ